MKNNLNRIRPALGLVAATLIALGGCTPTLQDAYNSEHDAVVGMMSTQNRALREVPPPNRRITVAVYGMPDLTGQYKEDDSGQNLSRAVTQGGAAVLIKALQDAGERRWFSVLDRSNLDNLLRERQIVTEMRRIYRGEDIIDPTALGPLDHAGIIIEGAIVGYDTNTMTGGIGARYLGIGGNERWKLDTVTITLRAVSTATGEVLTSVTVRKPIASSSTQGIIFTYIALDELLEAETGIAMNEPKQIAIEEAIEKGVMALIAEGATLGLWQFDDHRAGQRFVEGYHAQKFDGRVPALARNPAPPRTNSPASIMRTVPKIVRDEESTQISERRVPPTIVSPPPNTPGSAETLG